MNTLRYSLGHWFMVIFFLNLSWWALPVACADEIDTQLYKQAGKVMDELARHGYKNVGVLKFQVKKPPAEKPSLMVGRLNIGMATRLENALILNVDEKNPIGVTRSASQVAAQKNSQATYLTETGRKNLFAAHYPLAWSNKDVAVDAFVTGLVEVSRNMKKTTVIIQSFDRKHAAQLRELSRFSVDTDRGVLCDINQNFVITKRALKALAQDGVLSANELDNEATNPDNLGKGALARVREYLDFTILVDGAPVVLGPDDRMPTPAVQQRVIFKVRNAKPHTLGLLLRINGMNTLHNEREEKNDLREYSWWILEPGKDYEIRGFYPSRDRLQPIVALPADLVDQDAQLGEDVKRHGFIQLDIFANVTAEDPGVQLKERKVLAFRSVTARSSGLAQLQSQIEKNMNRRIVGRNFLVPFGEEQAQLTTSDFDGTLVANCSIGYR